MPLFADLHCEYVSYMTFTDVHIVFATFPLWRIDCSIVVLFIKESWKNVACFLKNIKEHNYFWPKHPVTYCIWHTITRFDVLRHLVTVKLYCMWVIWYSLSYCVLRTCWVNILIRLFATYTSECQNLTSCNVYDRSGVWGVVCVRKTSYGREIGHASNPPREATWLDC